MEFKIKMTSRFSFSQLTKEEGNWEKSRSTIHCFPFGSFFIWANGPSLWIGEVRPNHGVRRLRYASNEHALYKSLYVGSKHMTKKSLKYSKVIFSISCHGFFCQRSLFLQSMQRFLCLFFFTKLQKTIFIRCCPTGRSHLEKSRF